MKYNFLKLTIFLSVLFVSCNKKIIKKSISNDDLTVNWYFYSYISNTSNEIIELKKENFVVIVAKTDETYIKDVLISNDTILIKRFKPDSIYESDVFLEGDVLGYKVVHKLEK